MEPEHRIRELLFERGACAAGFAGAEPVDEAEWRLFEEWLAKGWHAGMDYMTRYGEMRRDPRLLLDGAKSIISVAFNYRQPNDRPGIAAYALGEDYHRVLKRLLYEVAEVLKSEFGGEYRVTVDSAPILERYWARKAGVGFRSPLNGNIIVPGVGSMVFLAEIITTLELKPTAPLFGDDISDDCKVYPCPTGALKPGGVIDSRRCINYLTIEHRGEWDVEQKRIMELPGAKERLFGCDCCQLASPHNQGAPAPMLPEFRSNPDLPRRKSPLSRRKK